MNSNALFGACTRRSWRRSLLQREDALEHSCRIWNRERPRLDALEVFFVEMNDLQARGHGAGICCWEIEDAFKMSPKRVENVGDRRRSEFRTLCLIETPVLKISVLI